MRVSVCIPTADRPALFREAVASVEAQTYKDIELVVSDNSLDAASRAENERFLAERRALSVVFRPQPTRVDQTANFNTLVDIASGELWTLLPDDDLLRPQAIERAVGALEAHPDCAFTFADHSLMRPDGTIDETASHSNSAHFGRTELREGVYHHKDLFQLALRQSMCLQTMTFRRDVIRAFRFMPGIFMCDFSLGLRLGASSEPIKAYYISERVADYRIHSAQATSEMARIALLRNSILAMRTTPSVPESSRHEYDQKLAQNLTALSIAETESGELASARSNALVAWKLAPGVRTATGVAIAHAPSLIFLAKLYRAARDIKATAAPP